MEGSKGVEIITIDCDYLWESVICKERQLCSVLYFLARASRAMLDRAEMVNPCCMSLKKAIVTSTN